jgi:hypothetical protein
LAGFALTFLLRAAVASIGSCCPTGLRSFIVRPQLPRPGRAPAIPLVLSKPLSWRMVPPERNFFAAAALRRYRLIGRWGAWPTIDREAFDSGGNLVDISSSCTALAISSPVRAGSFREPGVGRCLRRGDPGGPGAGPEGTRYGSFHPDRSLAAFHEDLEFGRAERQVVGR